MLISEPDAVSALLLGTFNRSEEEGPPGDVSFDSSGWSSICASMMGSAGKCCTGPIG